MLKLKPSLFSLSIIFILCVLGCSPSNTAGADKQKYIEYSDPKIGISLQYTPELEVETTDPTCLVRFKSKKEHGDDKFIENIAIHVKDLDPQTAQAARMIEDEQRNYLEQDIGDTSYLMEAYKQVPNFTLISAKFVNYGSFEGQRVIYTSQIGSFQLEVIQVAVLKNGKSFMFTYTGEQKNYETYEKVLDAMMRTVKFSL